MYFGHFKHTICVYIYTCVCVVCVTDLEVGLRKKGWEWFLELNRDG